MNENQRIRLSRQMLRDSLTMLLQTKSIHTISVREICEGAEINRTTFYKYYGDQYDLLRDMEDHVLTQIEGYLGSDDTLAGDDSQKLSRTLAFIDENLDLCRILCNNNVDPEFPKKLFSLPPIRHLLEQQLTDTGADNKSGYVFDFIVNGGFSIIRSWMNKEDRESPEEFASFVSDTIMKLFPVSAESHLNG